MRVSVFTGNAEQPHVPFEDLGLYIQGDVLRGYQGETCFSNRFLRVTFTGLLHAKWRIRLRVTYLFCEKSVVGTKLCMKFSWIEF